MTEEIGKRFGDMTTLPPEIKTQLVRRKNLTSIPEIVITILLKAPQVYKRMQYCHQSLEERNKIWTICCKLPKT